MSRSIGREQARPSTATPAHGICFEVFLLFVICTLDMLSSAWLFQNGLAVEGNPVLRSFADAGTAPFIAAKLLSFLPALVAAEWYRRMRPHRARPLLRFVIASYLGIYVMAVGGQLV